MLPAYGYDDVTSHAGMLMDAVRMRAFQLAIARGVRPGDVVVDVGSGTGILAILAAKAGARRVFAIERGPMASGIAQAAQDNGVGDVVEVFRGDARVLPLPEPPNVLISEMIGSFGIEEDFLGLLGTVKKRCTPDVRVIPNRIDVQAALVTAKNLTHELTLLDGGTHDGEQLGAQLRGAQKNLVHHVLLDHVAPEEVKSTVVTAGSYTSDSPRPAAIRTTVHATADAAVAAIATWFSSELISGVLLNNSPLSPRTHWAQVLFPLWPPLALHEGDAVDVELRLRMITDRSTWAWHARVQGPAAEPARERRGDAMASLVGGRQDVLQQLGIIARDDFPPPGRQLQLWADMLDGGFADVETLTQRLYTKRPTEFRDLEDARDAVRGLFRAGADVY